MADALRLSRAMTLKCGLGGRYRTGPDIGTTQQDTAVIHRLTPGWAFCRPEALGGSGNLSAATARGVHAGGREEPACDEPETDARIDAIGAKVDRLRIHGITPLRAAHALVTHHQPATA
ncbi:hypothetical protein [Lentzea sp.]|uniref:hypothetical protein n=1 Tax=Lentzea sp. TaxID=56099 RepID=UPI002C54CD4B|nr:hypothetical protein [Lentzea sp.]HUQ58400.1 hypothetical protein [Lentzea sp.]